MSDDIFDPEIHAAGPNGEPTLNKDGSFRKKRRDAGAKSARASRSRSAGAKAAPLVSQRDRYAKTLGDTLGVVVAGASMADPVMGYAAARLAPLWSEGLADLAMDQPWLAAALEKAAPLGAATALAGLAVMTVAQFAHLAGKVPAEIAKATGGMSRPEIETVLEQRGVALRQQAEADRETHRLANEWADQAESEAMSHA